MIAPGLMQPQPLLIGDILRYAALAHPDREIVSRLVDEPSWRYDYRGLAARAAQCANMLGRLGIDQSERVSSLAWNTHRHLELFFAVPGMGAILHTANPRMSDEQIAYTINHAGSTLLCYDWSFVDLVERLRPRLNFVTHFVVLASRTPDAPNSQSVQAYEALLSNEKTKFGWPTFDENAGAFLCYTSGTTGNPKGVLYSHRSTVLHAMAAGLSGAFNISAFDCILPCASFYHATAWGLPFIAAINGAKLVLPCDRFDGSSLSELIHDEGVTFSGGVPTIWTMYLDHLTGVGGNTGTLRQVAIGGSAMPRVMAETFERRYGVAVRQLWGMTEINPLGVISTPTPKLAAEGQTEQSEELWSHQGRLRFGLELQIIDEEGRELPHDGKSAGSLLVRGPWVIERYFGSDQDAVDRDGWFDTGDIGSIDRFGFLRITDRKKDVIKSGGEWISSIDVENIASAYPGVKIAAVVGVPHPKWEERPILVIEAHEGQPVSQEALQEFLASQIVRWWMPDAIFFENVPLTATGKIDKKAVRTRFEKCLSEPKTVGD